MLRNLVILKSPARNRTGADAPQGYGDFRLMGNDGPASLDPIRSST